MEINEQKRQKFMENASKRVNNVMHNIQILEPMARSNTYDFTKNDVEEMFAAMQETLDNVKGEFYKKFEGRARAERKSFAFGQNNIVAETTDAIVGNDTASIADTANGESVEEVVSEVESIADDITDNINE